MRSASLDLGSNTLRLLVAESLNQSWRAIERGLATPRLGRGLAPGKKLDPVATEEALEAARGFVKKAREAGAERIDLVATQACRIAADGAEFVTRLGRELFLDSSRVITGQEEARLSSLGVMSRLEAEPEGLILVDVGGGSSEFSALDGSMEPISLPLGAVVLTQRHITTDPPDKRELISLRREVETGLEQLTRSAPSNISGLVATAGTACTIGQMMLASDLYDPEKLNNLVVKKSDLEALFRRLADMTTARRKDIPGLEPKRADIILAGMAIIDEVLACLGLQNITVVDAGLLEGVILQRLHKALGQREGV